MKRLSKSRLRRIGWAALAWLAIVLHLVAGGLVVSAEDETAVTTPAQIRANFNVWLAAVIWTYTPE